IKNKNQPDSKILDKMEQIRNVISKLLDLRIQKGVKVRQPLASATVPLTLESDEQQIIKDELNVKEVHCKSNKIDLDFKLTPKLKEEGLLREVIRNLQDIRKANNYHFGQPANFIVSTDEKTKIFFQKYLDDLKKATNVQIIFEEKGKELGKFKLEEKEVIVSEL
ncbi:MAG: DUF5915 domain-containing protein, partial [Patescibacteria group bacterium]|nr:DUF5915 domain-containing protein [Patescibacteria group bacterium]